MKGFRGILFLAAIVTIAAFSFFKRNEHAGMAHDKRDEIPVANADSREAGLGQVPRASDDKLQSAPATTPGELGPGSTMDPRARQPIYAALVKGGSLDARVADALIQGQKFDEAIDALADAADAHSLEQTDRYRKELTQNLQLANQGLAIEKMACAGPICMASIQDSGDHSPSLMAATTSMPEDLPMSSAIFHTIPDPLRPGASIQRIIFSNNPQVRSISVPR